LTRARLPGPAAGRRIGLLGGSFNPAHGGHLHVAETAMKRLRLDAVFHRWKDWQTIACTVPIAIVSRPGTRLSRALPFTRRFAHARLREADAARLAGCTPPAWVYLRGPDNPLSSTALRRAP
jgi:nicotinic acid mononucleotide adenylyltransferase